MAKQTPHPTAAIIECAVCETPYVLRWTIALDMTNGDNRECFAYYPDCATKRRCEAEAKKTGASRARLRTDHAGEPQRIDVMSVGK